MGNAVVISGGLRSNEHRHQPDERAASGTMTGMYERYAQDAYSNAKENGAHPAGQ
jgi:hypothetical protein